MESLFATYRQALDSTTMSFGGRKKGKKQISTVDDGYLVADEYAYQNKIPLWMFGFIY